MSNTRLNRRVVSSCVGGIVVAVTAIAMAASSADAETIMVPADYPSIGAAIEAADDGCTILVADGFWVGRDNRDMDFEGKLITVRSENGPFACVIDCRGEGRAFRFHSGETAAAVVEGFTIANGAVIEDNGGAILCESSAPTIRDCVFLDNAATGFSLISGGGGAISCLSGSQPAIIGCTFERNSANGGGPETASGGAIQSRDSSPAISDCEFVDNRANGFGGKQDQASGIGGAIACDGQSTPSLTDCSFTGNAAVGELFNGNTGLGGAVALSFGADAEVSGCTFSANSATGLAFASGIGGAVFVLLCEPTIDDCVFEKNTASIAGGGMWVQRTSVPVRDCSFVGNTAQSGGAIAVFDSGTPTIARSSFEDNSNVVSEDPIQQQIGGGAIATVLSSVSTIRDCRFTGNRSLSGVGGAVSTTASSEAVIVGCEFFGNESFLSGGAVNNGLINVSGLNVSGTTLLVNCLFGCNRSGKWGGALFNDRGALTAVNCTVVRNEAALAGGAVCSLGFGSVTGVNGSIVRANTALVTGTTPAGTQIEALESAFVAVTYSIVEGGWPGVGNIDADPHFVDVAGPDGDPATCADNDYRLAQGSPAIDAGDNDAYPADTGDLDGDGDTAEPIVGVDLDGKPRFVDDVCIDDAGNGSAPVVDIGAYEFQLVIDACDCNRNGNRDSEDIASGDSDDFNLNGIPDECEAPFEGAAMWIDPAGGLFQDAANWLPGTPDAGNAAVFNLEAAFTVVFVDDILNDRLIVRRGDILFDVEDGFDPYRYLLGAVIEPAIIIGEQATDDPVLTVRNGELRSLGDTRIGSGVASRGTLIVSGPAAEFATNDDLCVGCFGEGVLIIEDGARADNFQVVIGEQTGSFGSVFVRGDGTVWSVPLFIVLDRGTLHVEAGATVVAGIEPFSGIFVLPDSEISGDGLIDSVVINVGAVKPVAGSGPLTIQGAYVQRGQFAELGSTSGGLTVEIGGTTPGVEYGQLRVQGLADLGGGLFVQVTDDFEPGLGDAFQLVDADFVENQFDVAFLPALADGRFMRVTYGGSGGGFVGSGVVNVDVELLEDFVEFGVPSGTLVPGQPSDAILGDFDEDGLPDLAITIPAETAGNDGTVLVLINDGTGGGFEGGQQITVGVDPSSVAIGLFDGDGSLDLAVANAGDDDVSILFGNGDGTFVPPLPENDVPVGAHPISIAAGNLHDTDGNLPGETDLVVANRDSDSVSILFNDGDGAFETSVIIPLPIPRSTDPWDVDNDKDVDLVVAAAGDDTVRVFENLGGGQFAPAVVVPVGKGPVAIAPTEVTLDNAGFDLDQNGFADIITANFDDGTISIVLNEGGFQFAPAVNLPVGGNALSLAALDMDIDGDIDVATVIDDPEDGTRLVALRNDLNGGDQLAFAEPIDLGGEAGALFVLSGDLDGDEDDDLVTISGDLGAAGGGATGAGGDGSSVSVLPNLVIERCPDLAGDTNGDCLVDFVDLLAVIVAWGPCPDPPKVCPGDLTGDGVVDLADLIEVLGNWS